MQDARLDVWVATVEEFLEKREERDVHRQKICADTFTMYVGRGKFYVRKRVKRFFGSTVYRIIITFE